MVISNPAQGCPQIPGSQREADTHHSGSQDDLEEPPTHSKGRWTPGSVTEQGLSQNVGVLQPIETSSSVFKT